MSQENLYLENRKVLRVSGLNCVDFLNNILTNDFSKLTLFETRPSTILSPQGRILYDILVSLDFSNYSEEKSILIEHDLFCEHDLIKKLNMYNLRKEVKVEKTNYKVFVTINQKRFKNSLKDKRFLNANVNINRIYTKNKDNPLIRDLIIEGLSLARTQKEEFASILNSNNGDISALFKTLKEFSKN